jgi:PAS domain S-box-containing protein
MTWKYEELFGLSSELLCVVGADGRIISANPAFCTTFGYQAEELESGAFRELVHRDDRPQMDEALEAPPSSRGPFALASRLRCKDGSYRPVDFKCHTGPESRILYLLGTDLTERRAAERARHELTSRYEAILAEIPDIVAEVNVDKVYTWVNRAGYEFFGDDVIGKEASFYFEGPTSATYEVVQPLFEGSEETIVLESWQRRRDGEMRLLAWWCRGLKDETGRVIGTLSTARDITNQRLTEAALQESQQTVLALFENAAQGILWVNPAGRILSFNAMAEKMFGYRREEIVGKILRTLLPEKLGDVHEQHRRRYFENPRSRPMGLGLDLVARRKDGTEFPVEISLSHVPTASGTLAVAFVNDVSERRRAEVERQKLERTLEHATKMEAVGRLAGGIAHDFNNLLTALSGFAEVVLDELPEDHMLYEGAKETLKTCQRATTLVRRLLAVSRRQMLQPEVIDLNSKIAEIEKILRSVLGEDIELLVKLQAELGFVRADQSQIEQVILNLVVNARDAMPTGGRLIIATERVDVEEGFQDHHLGLKPGPYVMISVSDTGTGMDRETLKHIFEPFFTTKEKGKGTGLGLATVYGIVSQSEGRIWAYSEPGQGTTFRIYLPRITRTGETEAVSVPPEPASLGSETVLVVEDERAVRLVAVGNLRKAGYQVLEAGDGEEALRLASAHEGPIHLVLSDVLMPGIHGPELVKRLEESRPGIRALFMSGHADDALLHHGILEGGLSFLEKPFTRQELTKKVREVLDGSGSPVSAPAS